LLWWTKRLIALRKRHKAFGRGSLEFLLPDNPKVLAFVRSHDDEHILVVANLSRFVQHVELDLKAFQGRAPEQLFAGSALPPIPVRFYPRTLGPHAFYAFALGGRRAAALGPAAPAAVEDLPVLSVAQDWAELFHNAGRDRLAAVLPAYLQRLRAG